jgi:hypothetical protein
LSFESIAIRSPACTFQGIETGPRISPPSVEKNK